jgi:hypothetical protein
MIASFESYLDEVFPSGNAESPMARTIEIEDHEARLLAFPYSIILQLAYPQLDFADRWCWQQFGPMHGECWQHTSEYPACSMTGRHTHEGKWTTYWLAKVDYDFGFNEWLFIEEADRDKFLAFVPAITWGEKF